MNINVLSRRLAARTRPLPHHLRSTAPLAHRPQRRWLSQEDIDDPGMNGGYINPPATLRQFRDPYADWWDKQERRNFGEPLHEDNDILGIFSPYEYTHFKVGWGLCCIGMFIASFLGVVGVVRVFHNPDVPFVERGYEGGLDRELGGEGTVHARTEDGID